MTARASEGRPAAFDFYGLPVRVESDWSEVIDAVCLDYAWFRVPEAGAGGESEQPRRAGRPAPPLALTVIRAEPDYSTHAGLAASFVTPRNVVYQEAGATLVEYFGRALLSFDRAARSATITTEDAHLAHEAAYQFLMSQAGEHLDRCGLVRLHALGLSGAQGGVAVMLPSGGGKSTLAVRALEARGVRILSEDTPLLDRRGVLHPFLLRLGINETDAARFAGRDVRRMERMEFHPKLLLAVDEFADRLEQQPQPLSHLVIGRRALGMDASLDELPRRAAAGAILREAVVGLGVYQGMEFVLQRGMRDALGMAGLFGARALACASALARARVWQLTLGHDRDRNWAALERLLVH